MSNNHSPLDEYREFIEALLAEGHSKAKIAELLRTERGVETSRHSLRRAIKRWDSWVPTFWPDPSPSITTATASNVSVTGDTASFISAPQSITLTPGSSDTDDAERLVKERGFDPEVWDITDITVNEWDAPVEGGGTQTMRQLKVHLRKKRPSTIPVPARSEGYQPKKNKPPLVTNGLIAILGDQHAPHHDQELHERVVDWLADNKPMRGVLLGDLVDFPEQSRHRHDPFWHATAQECLDSAYGLLRDYVDASPDTEWDFCAGNHSDRLRNKIIDQARDLYGLRPGSLPHETETEPALGLRHLLRLDELGIRYEESNGSYEHARIRLNNNLAVVHGHKATRGSGTTALKTLTEFGHSVVMGHSHRASIVYETKYDIHGNPETLTAAEAGCLCQIKGGLGYTVNGDWQQGFCTASIFSDKLFKLDLATYIADTGVLLWRDKQYD